MFTMKNALYKFQSLSFIIIITWLRGYVATWLRGYVAMWLHGYAATGLSG